MIGGKGYRLATDFRAGIAHFEAVHSGKASQADILRIWYLDDPPEDLDAAFCAAVDFYRCGRPPEKRDERANEPPPYSFTADAGAMIADFQRVYGIDLTAARLHWWRFSALLEGLLGHSLAERVRYRVCDPGQIKDSRLRGEFRKLHRRYALDAHGAPRREPTTLEEYNEMLLKRARGEA